MTSDLIERVEQLVVTSIGGSFHRRRLRLRRAESCLGQRQRDGCAASDTNDHRKCGAVQEATHEQHDDRAGNKLHGTHEGRGRTRNFAMLLERQYGRGGNNHPETSIADEQESGEHIEAIDPRGKYRQQVQS